MEGFCGSQLWNATIMWNTNDPEFTLCFKKTFLTWAPLTLLWLFSPLEFWYTFHSLCRDIPRNWLYYSKQLLTTSLLIISLFDEVFALWQLTKAEKVYPVDFLNPLLKIFSYELVFILVLNHRSRGISRSGLLFWFWFFSIIVEAFQLRSELMTLSRKPENIRTIYPSLSLVISLAIFILHFILTFFKEPMPRIIFYPVTDKSCPIHYVPFPSLLTFSWVNGLILKGNKWPLEYNHLWHINYELSSKFITPLFDKHFESKENVITSLEENSLIADFTGECSMENTGTGSCNEFHNIVRQNSMATDAQQAMNRKSILPALWKSFRPSFIFSMVLCLFQVILSYVNPQILKQLIIHINISTKESKESNGKQIWKGYLFSVGLFVVVMCQTIVSSQYFFRVFTTGLKIRVALTSVIYRKALLLSSASKKERTIGQIVNLMVVDVNKCADSLPFLNMMWAIPLRITFAIVWLWRDLGYSVLAGLLVLAILLPVQVFVATTNKRYQMKQMKFKDERIRLMTEILTGFKSLRLYAWETFFEKKVMKIRNIEVKYLKRISFILASMSFFWLCTPYLMALASFSCYILSDKNHILTPQIAFVSLSLFNLLQIPLALFPIMVGALVQAFVSLRRINDFLNCEEINEDDITHDMNEADAIVIENGTFSWGDQLILKNINLRIPQGSLVAVVGTVGSGKSSLISALLGDVPKLNGRVNIKGKIAYIPQQAWILNGTVRDNILFGKPYDKTMYDLVVEACALKQDFLQLPSGDLTKINAKGNNLSGGQRQRLSIARAVYSGADLFLMDDPLSAVDSQVGKFIFDNIIGPDGLLANKTRLVVTQSVNNLHSFSRIVVLNDGIITEEGTFNDLLSRRGAFSLFVLQYLTATPSDSFTHDPAMYAKKTTTTAKPNASSHSAVENLSVQRPQMSRAIQSSDQLLNKSASAFKSSSAIRKTESNAHAYLIKTPSVLDERSEPFVLPRGEKISEEEFTETGSVKFAVYKDYLNAMGIPLVLVMLFLYTMYQVFLCGGNIWLSHYTENGGSSTVFLVGYGLFGLGQMICVGISTSMIYLGALIASKKLHNMMLHNILRLPMMFFNTTPYSRILNRFSKDVDALDSILPVNLQGVIGIAFMVAGILMVIAIFLPVFIVFIIPLMAVYVITQRFYVTISRQLKRMESINRSPIYSHFEESLSGVSSIRAYGVQQRFIEENHSIIERSIICIYPGIICDRWLQVRLETVGNLIIFVTSLCAVLKQNTMAPGDAGLIIAYALTVTVNLNMLVRNVSMVETNIVGAERIKEYTKLPRESLWTMTPNTVSIDWPERGEIRFENYKFRYREGLEYALKGVSFKIEGGEKVGVVGRTGAGKSSLTMALFRVIEASSGAIIIDGIDISTIGLYTLRSRLTIIPQEPILFSGTLRRNLDPGHQHKDKKLQQALETAHLSGLTTQLDLVIMEGGENFSLGQRQLLCLARALLRKTKVLILDEATANIDLQTEELIQETIRSQFAECTVLTIAHRMKTILDSDRILVLANGQVVEFDTPKQLLHNKSSAFYSLAKDAGIV